MQNRALIFETESRELNWQELMFPRSPLGGLELSNADLGRANLSGAELRGTAPLTVNL